MFLSLLPPCRTEVWSFKDRLGFPHVVAQIWATFRDYQRDHRKPNLLHALNLTFTASSGSSAAPQPHPEPQRTVLQLIQELKLTWGNQVEISTSPLWHHKWRNLQKCVCPLSFCRKVEVWTGWSVQVSWRFYENVDILKSKWTWKDAFRSSGAPRRERRTSAHQHRRC